MALPDGWDTFASGGLDLELCDDGTPPEIVPPSPSGTELSCTFDGSELELTVTGGVPPFEWVVVDGNGNVNVTDTRSATVSIRPASPTTYDEAVGKIAFFKLHAFSFSGQLTIADTCTSGHYVESNVDVRLRPYDCVFRYIDGGFFTFGGQVDNIAPDHDIALDSLNNPVGDVVTDRVCTLSTTWTSQNTPDPSHLVSNPAHWSVNAFGCSPAGDPGNVAVHVAVTLAGKNCVHGTVWSEAPAFSEILNIVPLPIADFANPGWLDPDTGLVFDIEGESFLDVRTQEMVDAECCVVPAGEDMVVMVTDANGSEAVIVIPVVEQI